jgi:uncharacterized membrane protein (DUF485 family)
MTSPPTDEPAGIPSDQAQAYIAVAASPDFAALRRTFRRFVFPLAALFLVWYLLYVVMSNYAHGFMSRPVVGNVHVGIVFGLLQFVSTFVITMVYARWADRTFDAKADAVAAQVGSHRTGELR